MDDNIYSTFKKYINILGGFLYKIANVDFDKFLSKVCQRYIRSNV